MKPEAQLSCAVRELVTLYRLRERCICFKIHNDLMPTFKARVPIGAFIKKLKNQGCEVGVGDWIFIWPDLYKSMTNASTGELRYPHAPALSVGFIELKIDTDQRQSQKDFEQWCLKVGPYYRIAKDINQVQNIWRDWRLI